MVVLFVVLTILVFLTIDFLVQKAQKFNAKPAEMKIRKPFIHRVFNRKAQPSEGFWMKNKTHNEQISPPQP